MRRHIQSITRFLSVLALGLALAACGGDGDSVTPTPVPPDPAASEPGTPGAPTAAFTAPETATAQQVVVFDASASTSSDGSALTYVWDFGDGLRGGGRSIARSFATAGARTVTLTVIDGSQRSTSVTRTVTVAAPGTGAPVTVTGRITAPDGTPIEGVSVAAIGADPSATSDASGKVSLPVARAATVTLRLSKAGYADQFVPLTLPAGTGGDAYFEAVQSLRDGALTLADAAVGGTLTGRDGAGITVPAGAFIDASGVAVTGPVQVNVTPVDATQPGGGGFPGRFDGIQPDGTTTPIVSFGVVEFVPSSAAGKLQLAPGRTATIEVPIYGARRPDGTVLAVGDEIPLWSLDETTSMWIREGSGQAVASATSPSGLAMRATVSHLSWWNADLGFDPYGPEPRCEAAADIGIPEAIDTFANATICNMLAEVERTLGGNGATGGRARALADPPPARFAGYSRQTNVPVGGGVTLPVPPDLDIRLTAHALNGTWSGTKVVRGTVGVREPVVIQLRPNASTSTSVEDVTIPFDAIRTAQAGRIDQYRFTGSGARFAHVTVSPGDVNSRLSGGVRLLQGSTELGRATFGGNIATLRVALPADGSYVVAVTGEANVPGGYHIRIETPGEVMTETLGPAFAVTKDIPAFTRYRGTFTHAGTAAYFALRNDRVVPGPEALRILGADDAVVASLGGSAPGVLSQAVVPLPAGAYTAEVVIPDGEAVRASIRGEPTAWLPVAELPPAGGNTYRGMIDLVTDRNGRPVVGYWDADLSATPRTAVLRLRRWTGTAWETVGTDQAVALGNGFCSTLVYATVPRTRMAGFTFDGANNPLVVYRIDRDTGAGDGSSVATTTLRRFAGGSWQGVGSNDGKLPLTARTALNCDDPPMVGVNAADQPVVAYRTDTGVTVQRFDGAAWKGLADATADSFPDVGESSGGNFALGVDASRRVWLAMTDRSSVVVRRFDAQATAWTAVGPNGGTVAGPGNVQDFIGGRLVFDAAGNATFATFATVPAADGGRSYTTAVYRHDGSAWRTSLYPLGTDEGASPSRDAVALATSGNDVLVGWSQALRGVLFSPVVHRQTGSAWVPIGGGVGEVPQFALRGINTQVQATSPQLLQTVDGTYLATLLWQASPGQVAPGHRLVLSRKVAD